MKQPQIPQADVLGHKIEAVVQVEKKRIHQARIMHKPGTHIWEFDMQALRLRKAPIEASVDLKGNVKRKIDMKPGCYYIQALNVKNALRKFEKQTGIKLHYQPLEGNNHG
jgi:hypothetical protein